jgi:phospholipase/carboxylesterase
MHDLARLCSEINTNYIYILPNAPFEVQSEIGMIGRSWRNPSSLNLPSKNSGLTNTEKQVISTFMLEIAEKFYSTQKKMIIGGFSQGAGVASEYALHNKNSMAGLMLLSGTAAWLNEENEKPIERNDSLSIFIGHGINDTMIPVNAAKKTLKILKSLGFNPEYHEYVMGHEINNMEINDIRKWLENFK